MTLVILLLLVVTVPVTAAGVTSERRTLDRFHDPVVVGTGLLAGLSDHRTAPDRMYAASNGALSPIPFQFDARSSDGTMVLGDDPATFDSDDELVFMAKDTGDRVGADALPAGSDTAIELEVTDRARGARGWAYLVHFPADPPAPSPVRYATFDASRGEARALFYDVEYAPGRSNYLAGVKITPAAGGTGDSLILRTLMRISPTFSLLLTTWSPTFTEENFTVSTLGVRNGPVRSVRRVRQSLDLGRFFPELPSGTVNTFYYFSSFSTPSTFKIPALVLGALRGFRFEAMHDVGDRAESMRYWDASNPAGLPLRHARARVGADDDHDWWVVSGPAGTLLNTFTIPPQWRDWGVTRGTVTGDDTDIPAGLTGGGAGYSLRHMTNLREPGAYDMQTAMVILPRPYEPGDEAGVLAMLHEPLVVRGRRLFDRSPHAIPDP